MKVIHVVGARPNFMKVAPIMAAMAKQPEHFEQLLVHTGQHYDENMSKVFFRDLQLPEPDVYLGVGSGTHAQQTARVMQAFEPVALEHKPDWVLVVGDVNSTLACALVCAKLGIKVAHVEAGLRSFDRTMPEEINRLLTDQIADLLFTTEESANANLRREGIAPEKIHFVGNVMIDSLVRHLPLARKSAVLQELDLTPAQYAVVTLHRPANVDNPETLAEIFAALLDLADQMLVVFPVHPRTRKALDGLVDPQPASRKLKLIEPLGYVDFLQLYSNARLVLTDSGGLQEETTYLGIPCLTLRPNTERPVTLTLGTNRLVPVQRAAIGRAAKAALNGQSAKGERPPLWDGRAAERIALDLLEKS
jgi:UDP-N-acetylglucosamine 2-epimerase (non-hydrolysing)